MNYRDDPELSTAALAAKTARSEQEAAGAMATEESQKATARLDAMLAAEGFDQFLPPLGDAEKARYAAMLRAEAGRVIAQAWRHYLGAEDT